MNSAEPPASRNSLLPQRPAKGQHTVAIVAAVDARVHQPGLPSQPRRCRCRRLEGQGSRADAADSRRRRRRQHHHQRHHQRHRHHANNTSKSKSKHPRGAARAWEIRATSAALPRRLEAPSPAGRRLCICAECRQGLAGEAAYQVRAVRASVQALHIPAVRAVMRAVGCVAWVDTYGSVS